MSMYRLTRKAEDAIASRSEITLRIIKGNNVIERILTPIGVTPEDVEVNVVVYAQTKIIYIDGKLGINDNTKTEEKYLPPVSTISHQIEETISILEQSGYKIVSPIF